MATSLEKQAPLSFACSEKHDSFKACSEKSPVSVAGYSEKQSSPLNPDDPHYFSKILQKNVINSSAEVDEDEDSGGEDVIQLWKIKDSWSCRSDSDKLMRTHVKIEKFRLWTY